MNWKVYRCATSDRWVACPPEGELTYFDSHEEAINHANEMTRVIEVLLEPAPGPTQISNRINISSCGGVIELTYIDETGAKDDDGIDILPHEIVPLATLLLSHHFAQLEKS